MRRIVTKYSLSIAGALALCVGLAASAQQAPQNAPLAVKTTSLPTAFARRPVHVQLEAEGGTPPYQWSVLNGALPGGVKLGEDGVLSGEPAQAGTFQFTVVAADSAKPAHQRYQRLSWQVLAPLLAQWSSYPKINGQRVDGAIKVSNQTGEDFDLTIIVLAVNEIGRATAIGYQHLTLSANTLDMEIPFGENLPPGSYEVNVDVVAEVPASNSILRTRLVTKERLQVVQGP